MTTVTITAMSEYTVDGQRQWIQIETGERFELNMDEMLLFSADGERVLLATGPVVVGGTMSMVMDSEF